MSVIQQATEDPVYFAKRNVLYAAGKQTAHSIAEGMMPTVVNQVGGAAAGFGKSIAGLVLVGIASAVSAGLVQMDYLYQRDNIAQWYKEELAAKLNKPLTEVASEDLEDIAHGNRVVAEELGRAKRNRTFGIAFSIIATIASLAVVALMPAASPSLLHLFSATAEQWGALLLNTAVGLAAYNAVKISLQWAGNKLFGLDTETTHDRIVNLQRAHAAGQTISQEQILSVFVKAHPELDQFVSTRFGVAYDELTLADKQMAAAELGKLVPLDRLAAQINAGETNVTELVFAVEGEASGVHRDRMDLLKKPGRMRDMWNKVCDKMGCRFEPKPEYQGMAMLQLPDTAQATDYREEKPGHSFVQGLGRAKLDNSAGYMKMLDQLDKKANAPYSQTIQ